MNSKFVLMVGLAAICSAAVASEQLPTAQRTISSGYEFLSIMRSLNSSIIMMAAEASVLNVSEASGPGQLPPIYGPGYISSGEVSVKGLGNGTSPIVLDLANLMSVSVSPVA